MPIFVIGIGVYLLRAEHPRQYVGGVSNRTLGLLAVAIGAVDLTVRLLRLTILR